MLGKYDHLLLANPIHPNQVDHYRKSVCHPSGAKSDPSDAGLILEVSVQTLANDCAQFTARHQRKPAPSSSPAEARREAVDDKTTVI